VTELPNPVDDGFCVGCGERSVHGLHMVFARDPDGGVHSQVAVPAHFQGWQGIVHGGVVALLLDEAMAYAAGARGCLGVTADLKMRFRKAVPVGEPLTVRGIVRWQRRNVLGIEASVADAAGVLLASGTGSFVSRGPVGTAGRFRDVLGP
jgi:uncharacterized protein (TIGR00369 family)